MEQSFCGLGVAEPSGRLRGVRLPPPLWNSEDLPQRVDFLASWGFNAILLDAFDLPRLDPFHKDEDQPAPWEKRLAAVSEWLHGLGWWVMAVVPVQLDLGIQFPRNPDLDEPIPCRLAPLHRRRILHRFESILRSMQGLNAIGIAVSEWPRCQCSSCQHVTFEEESAYYLRAFSAVMKRYARDLEFWVLPDPPSFSLLQEIRAEVPSGARFLVGPQDPEQKGGLLPSQTEEGLILDLSIPSRYEWLDTDQHKQILLDWEQEDEPCLLVAEVGNAPRFPLGLASFMRLVWRKQTGEPLPEVWLYRLVLPEEQWKDWRKWKDLNLYTHKRIHEHELPADINSIIFKEMPDGTGKPSFQPDLTTALWKSHQRLDLEDRVRPLLRSVTSIPEGVPLESHLLSRMIDIHSGLTELAGDDTVRKTLEVLELRVLENLRDRIGLLLSESRAGAIWRKSDIPDLGVWLEFMRDEE